MRFPTSEQFVAKTDTSFSHFAFFSFLHLGPLLRFSPHTLSSAPHSLCHPQDHVKLVLQESRDQPSTHCSNLNGRRASKAFHPWPKSLFMAGYTKTPLYRLQDIHHRWLCIQIALVRSDSYQSSVCSKWPSDLCADCGCAVHV